MPNSNLFTHSLLFFSREATRKPTAPGSLSHIICRCDLFSFAFILRSIKPKIQKYLAALYFIWRSIYHYLELSHVRLPISSAVTPKGLTTPLIHRVASICYLYAGVVYPSYDFCSREKPLVKTMAPRPIFIIYKIQTYLAAIYCYLFYLAFPRDLFIQSTTILPIFLPVRD